MSDSKRTISLHFMRHEQRYDTALIDCSLTSFGLSRALRKTFPGINPNKVICSPILRTIQTVYPYVRNRGLSIKLEDSLYEMINDQSSHYNYMKYLIPKIRPRSRLTKTDEHNMYNKLSWFHNLYTLISEISQSVVENLSKPLKLTLIEMDNTIDIDKKKYKIVLECVRLEIARFVNMLNDFVNVLRSATPDKVGQDSCNGFNTAVVVSQLELSLKSASYCLLFIDGLLNGRMSIDEKLYELTLKYDCYSIIRLLLQSTSCTLEQCDMYDVIDDGYRSLINIENYVQEDVETFENLFHRTSKFSKAILNVDEYNNSLCVSHLSVINAIIVNIFVDVYGGSALNELNKQFSLRSINFASFCRENVIKPGDVVSVTVEVFDSCEKSSEKRVIVKVTDGITTTE
ncbi:putative histidine phosphatase [Yasminevirus sp. GU-2018]|uniref:Putative histidine phosphatase n=1 Tax=Yasminevirus sp. GU-2018 TaxID=2420051 RepID=A0A5K0U8Y0_9VIRU|nr:putative histidine phosphatase [Yasminevirus sp. GU-2018]